jgi:hypothetical protein
MLRYKLRTLLILPAILPPLIWVGWTKYAQWRAEQERQRMKREIMVQLLLTGSQPPPSALWAATDKARDKP